MKKNNLHQNGNGNHGLKSVVSIVVSTIVLLLLSVFLFGCAEKPQIVKAGDLNFALTINPNPPRSGANSLGIKITDNNGQAVAGGMIDVTYSMPAMGNMPAMSSSVKAEEVKGGYQAGLDLSMEGTWNIRLESQLPDKPHLVLNLSITTGIKNITVKSTGYGHEGMEGAVTLTKDEEALLGVAISTASKIRLSREIRAAGEVTYDPDLYVAQEEYLGARLLGDADLIEASKKRLAILGFSDAQIYKLAKEGKAQTSLVLAGDNISLNAAVFENELAEVKEGLPVVIEALALPGKKLAGKIVGIPAVIDPMTRSAKVRIEADNPGKILKPGMYATVIIKIDLGNKLAVPSEAVINTGERSVVVMTDGQGNYVSRDVELGQKAEGYYEILSGLKAGEQVVTNGNFLIDSESRLRSAVKSEHHH